MHPEILYYIASFSIVLVLPAVGQYETTTEFNLNESLNNQSRTRLTCITKNNETGICVDKNICNDNFEIETYGRISESEMRIGSDTRVCSLDKGEWCCAKKNLIQPATVVPVSVSPPVTIIPSTAPPVPVTPPVTITPPVTSMPPSTRRIQNCVVTTQTECPWLVKLYHSGVDYPFCLGAMIGSKVILTTATCHLQSKGQFLWATVPGSANPEANYTIIVSIPHPKFNSGNRLNDLALLSTLTDIDWGSSGPKGACIDPQQKLEGECTAGNINDYFDLEVESLYVTEGACTSSGNVSDAMCGNAMFTNQLLHGTPIMCQKNNMYILSGMTKRAYDSSKALLGKIDYPWLINNLKEKFGLNDEDFLYSRNY